MKVDYGGFLGWGKGLGWRVTTNVSGVSFWGDEY